MPSWLQLPKEHAHPLSYRISRADDCEDDEAYSTQPNGKGDGAFDAAEAAISAAFEAKGPSVPSTAPRVPSLDSVPERTVA